MNHTACVFCGTEIAENKSNCPSCGQTQGHPVKSLQMGTELRSGEYTIGKVLGEGGFGITYKGAHTTLRRPVAIKELFPENAVRLGKTVSVPMNQNDAFRRDTESFLEEARTIANLNSQGIVNVFDFFNENGTTYIVMEYLEGRTLEQLIQEEGAVKDQEALKIADKTCEALAEVHSSNLLHRDIKPANIILTLDRRIVLIDFGSAREFQTSQTAKHTRILTEDYAAPEQYSTQARFGPYTDIFCLSATLFHAIAGVPPPRALERLQSGNSEIDFPVQIRDRMKFALQAGLKLRVQDRPQTVAEFRELLKNGSAVDLPRSRWTEEINNASILPKRRPVSGTSKLMGLDRPYEFNSQLYHDPTELAEALELDWEAAINDWQKGYITAWITRNVTGSSYERKIDGMLETPLFSETGPPPFGATFNQKEFTSLEATQERQFYRVLSILNPHHVPAYRGKTVESREDLGDWAEQSLNSRKEAKLLEAFMARGILLAHPKAWATKFHRDFVKEVKTYEEVALPYSRGERPTHSRRKPALQGISKHADLPHLRGERPKYSWHKVLMYELGVKSASDLLRRAKENKPAMRIGWFRDLVSDQSKGGRAAWAAAIEDLMPVAQKKRQNRVAWTWISVTVFFLFLLTRLLGN